MTTEMAEVSQVAPGVWAIPVVIPDNPLGFTLVHLLESDRGSVLVDAGWNHDRSWAALVDGVQATGHAIQDVFGVLLTHGHADHHGLSGRVREASGAWVAMHALDAAMITEQRNSHRSWLATVGAAFLAAGAGEQDFADVPPPDAPWPVAPPAMPDRLVAEGELVDVPGRRVRAIWTPGHTPGHVCYLLEDGGGPARGGASRHGDAAEHDEASRHGDGRPRLLTGDHVLPRISPHIGLWSPETPRDPLGEFLASLEKVAAMGVDAALPAHVAAFDGLAERARELVRHHEERCDELLGLVRQGPRTAWEIAEAVSWKRDWEGLPALTRRVALAETLAHLRHLERRGLVAEEPGPRPRRYIATPG